MSNTFEIACRDCKETYWFGQKSNDNTTIYKPDIFMNWLVKHSTCGEFRIINEYAENYPDWYDDCKQINYED